MDGVLRCYYLIQGDVSYAAKFVCIHFFTQFIIKRQIYEKRVQVHRIVVILTNKSINEAFPFKSEVFTYSRNESVYL